MVLTKYVDEAPRAEDKPKRELTINEFVLALAGDGKPWDFIATNNDGRIYKGSVKPDENGKITISSKKVPTEDEVKNRLQELKNKRIV